MTEGGVELIVTEKDNAARRIADILGGEVRTEAESRGDVTVYRWDQGRRRCIGLSGHVVGLDFPSEYEDWRAVEPVELIDAPVRTVPTRTDIVGTLQDLATTADRVVIATDYDREGELIGKEAYELVREVTDVPVDRVRFSSITDREVREAFDNRESIDFDLAAAGEARQEIDLVWGAALTRFLSLTAGRLGEEFVSVGRVQSPTLRLIVEREREIRAFEPEDYWELFADLAVEDPDVDGGGDDPADEADAFEAQYFYLEEGRETERIDEEDAAEQAREALSAAETATVTEVRRRTRTDEPPAPFDTTSFISAAGGLGYGADRAMSLAESLYTEGYITYPRTDNTVYPEDLDPGELLAALADCPALEDVARLVDGDPTEAGDPAEADLDPTRGDTESTDHPPIHPTDELPDLDELDDDERAVYELVARRFMATLAEPAEWAHLRVTADAGGQSLKANGKRLVDPGYHEVYPYGSTDETHLPAVAEGDSLSVVDVRLAAKQTRPPGRYGQSTLVERMDDLGLGTKSTRHKTIEKLYDRGYVEGDPPRPTALAMAVVDAVQQYADRIVSEEMTRQLERDMTRIAEGQATLEEVTGESREMLRSVFDSLAAAREEIGDYLRESLKEDRALGPCPECGDQLLIRESRRGSAFVGCDGYPDCEYTLPLPEDGEPVATDEHCADHGLRHVEVIDDQGGFVHGCPLCAEAEAGEGEVLGACPDCGADSGGRLRIKRLRNGSRLVGCDRYPDCEYSLPLPRRGDLDVRAARCEEHDLPEIAVLEDDDPWELGCPVCNYREYRARRAAEDGDVDLRSIDGVDEETERLLAEAEVTSVADLVASDPETVADRTDDRIDQARARGLRRAAIDAVEGLDEEGGDDDDGDPDEEADSVDPTGESTGDAGAEA